jgi:hypothetical protein
MRSSLFRRERQKRNLWRMPRVLISLFRHGFLRVSLRGGGIGAARVNARRTRAVSLFQLFLASIRAQLAFTPT